VTKNSAVLLQRAIGCFLAQSYPNKELVVLYEDDNSTARQLFEKSGYPATIKILCVEKGQLLGALRNYAIANSNGDFFCQWDDDDWYHTDRLEYQYQAIKTNHAAACVLDSWILFDSVRGLSYISGKRPWEGSLLCNREIMKQVQYPPIRQSEDTSFVWYLLDNGLLYVLRDMPQLYIYTHHGNNTFGADHFESLFECGIPLNEQLNREIIQMMQPGSDVLAGSERLSALIPLL